MNKIQKLYQDLKKQYGVPEGQWQLWCKRPKTQKEKEEVIIGAILTQRTNWKNVALAMANLKRAGFKSLLKVSQLKSYEAKPRKIGLNGFFRCLRPSGFYRQKGEYLLGLSKFIIRKYKTIVAMEKEPLGKLRIELLKLKGVGLETADSILLYALNKPTFVIDEYTRRLVKKTIYGRRTSINLKYGELQKIFEDNLPKNYKLYQDFHALIVIDGKNKLSTDRQDRSVL